jgi:hypothetical protein
MVVGDLFGQDGVTGKSLCEAAYDELARLKIGLRNGFAPCLVLHAEWASLEAGDEGRCFEGHHARGL